MMSYNCGSLRRALRAACLAGSAALAVCGMVPTGGCAPARFEEAVSYYAQQHRVSDASVRRVFGIWSLRFNELLISDLGDAIRSGEEGSEAEMRDRAARVLRAANALGLESALAEIERMPDAGRAELARRAECENTRDAIEEHYRRRSSSELEALLDEVRSLPADQLRSKLVNIRLATELSPDDRGRLGRQLALHWAAVPVWIGVAAEEESEKRKPPRPEKTFDRVVVWEAGGGVEEELLNRFAPTIVMEWPAQRDYPPAYDRIGEVRLAGERARIDVRVGTSRPSVYAYTSEAKIHGRRHQQLVYVWWFPERPPMMPDDAAAGHIDGDTLRITLDSAGRPAVFEVLQNCGCGHMVFVSRELEEAASEEFGGPLPDKRLAVEQTVWGKRSLIVGGLVEVPPRASRPVVYVSAGYHEISRISFDPSRGGRGLSAAEVSPYYLVGYEALERLPLGDGVASMFGPDGLVHNAGRKEGYLLAPTGMLSAGQPRQRGTQKIRWDDYSFDDPHLLERALRLPGSF